MSGPRRQWSVSVVLGRGDPSSATVLRLLREYGTADEHMRRSRPAGWPDRMPPPKRGGRLRPRGSGEARIAVWYRWSGTEADRRAAGLRLARRGVRASWGARW